MDPSQARSSFTDTAAAWPIIAHTSSKAATVKTRRSPGEGSISQRKDGRWQASLQVNGQRTTAYGRTRTEAAGKLRVLQGQAPAPAVNLVLTRRTVNDLLDAWLETKAPNLRPATVAQYTTVCDKHVRPALGKLGLAAVTPDKLQNLYTALRKSGLGRTVELVHALLGQAFDLAVLWRWLPENPCHRAVRPSHRAARKQIWTTDQVRAFLHGTRDHWLHPLWVVLAYSGGRLGEILALKWNDVDLVEGTIAISKTIQRVDGAWQITEPKTRSGFRVVSLPSAAVDALWDQAATTSSFERDALVFSRNGSPLHRATVAHAMQRQCDLLGLPRTTPHGLRHWHASALLGQGLPIPEVSQRLGHSNSSVTMSVYAHALGRSDARATEAISQAMA